jgi:hypothetical protein
MYRRKLIQISSCYYYYYYFLFFLLVCTLCSIKFDVSFIPIPPTRDAMHMYIVLPSSCRCRHTDGTIRHIVHNTRCYSTHDERPDRSYFIFTCNRLRLPYVSFHKFLGVFSILCVGNQFRNIYKKDEKQ